MKIRDIKKRGREAIVWAWPPVWASSYRGGDKLAVGPVGVLEAVERRDDQGLSLTMRYDNREHVSVLRWDPPPALDEVERVLRANIGREISVIGEVEVGTQ